MRTTTVRIGALSREVGLHPNWIRKLADDGVIPFERSPGGHRLFDTGAVRAALARRAIARGVAPGVGASALLGSARWEHRFPLPDLEEDRVWFELTADLSLDRSAAVARTMSYAFTEMLNNAIDHSGGTSVLVRFWADEHVWAFELHDDGEGVFAHLKTGLGLADEFTSLQELTKGKRTTAPQRHTGEGIFFTSKVVDVFQLASGGLRWTADNLRGDQAVGAEPSHSGTRVFAQTDTATTRLPADIFSQFTRDFQFVRTRPALKLFEVGVTFVSRSEARRLLDGLDDFTEVEVDFTGVEDVGQGFVDEMLRVWPSMHPGKTVAPTNMSPQVTFMVERGLPGPQPPARQ